MPKQTPLHFTFLPDSRTYTRASVPVLKMDIYDPRYPAHVWLMIFYGLLDAMWHVMCFWLIGAMSNDVNKLAIYSGFCMSFLCLFGGCGA